MRNNAFPGDEDTDLATEFRRQDGKVPRKLWAYYLLMDLPPVNPFKRMDVTSLEPCQFTVQCWDLVLQFMMLESFYT